MEEMPLVSIIMPSYNRKNVMGEAIDSCLRQTYSNIEVIICDDHSSDGTKEYIMNRMSEDDRIRFCENPKASNGANAARNTAIRIAKGKYLAFLDTDDYLLNNSVEIRVDTLQKNPKAAMVYGNVYCEHGRRREKWLYTRFDKGNISQKKFLMENLALCSQISIMFRKEVIDVIGMLDEQQKAWTDDGFVVAVGMKYPVIHCGKFVSIARKSEESMTGNKWNMYKGCKSMVNQYKSEIIKYASFRRYVLWRIRLLSAYCYARERASRFKIMKRFWQFFHEGIRDQIRPYFKVYCE